MLSDRSPGCQPLACRGSRARRAYIETKWSMVSAVGCPCPRLHDFHHVVAATSLGRSSLPRRGLMSLARLDHPRWMHQCLCDSQLPRHLFGEQRLGNNSSGLRRAHRCIRFRGSDSDCMASSLHTSLWSWHRLDRRETLCLDEHQPHQTCVSSSQTRDLTRGV